MYTLQIDVVLYGFLNSYYTNCIGHILPMNCLLKQVIEGKIEGKIEVMWRRERRRKQLLDELKEKRKCWNLTEDELSRTLWKNRFGRGYGPAARRTTVRINSMPKPHILGLQKELIIKYEGTAITIYLCMYSR
jgi:hypothetical protein